MGVAECRLPDYRAAANGGMWSGHEIVVAAVYILLSKSIFLLLDTICAYILLLLLCRYECRTRTVVLDSPVAQW